MFHFINLASSCCQLFLQLASFPSSTKLPSSPYSFLKLSLSSSSAMANLFSTLFPCLLLICNLPLPHHLHLACLACTVALSLFNLLTASPLACLGNSSCLLQASLSRASFSHLMAVFYSCCHRRRQAPCLQPSTTFLQSPPAAATSTAAAPSSCCQLPHHSAFPSSSSPRQTPSLSRPISSLLAPLSTLAASPLFLPLHFTLSDATTTCCLLSCHSHSQILLFQPALVASCCRYCHLPLLPQAS